MMHIEYVVLSGEASLLMPNDACGFVSSTCCSSGDFGVAPDVLALITLLSLLQTSDGYAFGSYGLYRLADDFVCLQT